MPQCLVLSILFSYHTHIGSKSLFVMFTVAQEKRKTPFKIPKESIRSPLAQPLSVSEGEELEGAKADRSGACAAPSPALDSTLTPALAMLIQLNRVFYYLRCNVGVSSFPKKKKKNTSPVGSLITVSTESIRGCFTYGKEQLMDFPSSCVPILLKTSTARV